MKKYLNLLCILFIFLYIGGCQSTRNDDSAKGKTEKNAELSAKETLIKSFELYKTYSGYRVNSYHQSNGLITGDNKLELTPMKERHYTYKEIVKGNKLYTVSVLENQKGKSETESGFTLSDYEIKIKTPEGVHHAWFDKVNMSDIELNYARYYDKSHYSENKDTYEEMNNLFLFDLYNYYINKYSDFFNFEKNIEGDKIVVTITCKDLKEFSDYLIQEEKKDNPEYDPYDVFGIKTSKNEITDRGCIWILDKEYNVIKTEDRYTRDYGDGIITTTLAISEFDQINEVNMNTEKIDALMKEAEASMNEDEFESSNSFGVRSNIDWDFK